MQLQSYLQRAGVTTGPLSKNTSHSGLEIIKKSLLGLPQFKGGEVFLVFGSALHEMWLENKCVYKLDRAQTKQLNQCLNSLNASPEAMSLLKDSIREEKLKVKLNGVEMAFILDIHNKGKRIGADLKTSGVRSLNEFITKAKEYGYFRQGVTYVKAANLKAFYFIAVTKEPIPRVFIFCIQDHPEEMHYAERELEFLLYFYKNYGNIIIKKPDETTNDNSGA